MDKSWMNEPKSSTPYLKGLAEFLDFAYRNANVVGEITCPCVKCANSTWVMREKATEHLVCNGIMKGYNTFIGHGEALTSHTSTEHVEVCKEIAQVGIWGTKSKGSEQNRWTFRLDNNHKLKKITIDHGDLIYSLMFTTEDSRGCLHDSEQIGGWNGGNEVCEVTFDFNEEIIGISGTVGVSTGTYAGYVIISSLSFITNKKTHGPFGKATGTPFSVPWNKGSLVGFYGLAGYYLDGIGAYLKASQGTARVGMWGTESNGGSQNRWSFRLEKNHKLTKITINHGDLISSLMFTSEDCMGCVHNSNKAGGCDGGFKISEVTLDWDEEISGIKGTIGVSTGTYAGFATISSLSFITNKRTHGPFGRATGTPFSAPWGNGSFAGFYGVAGYYINGIGVYLKATV